MFAQDGLLAQLGVVAGVVLISWLLIKEVFLLLRKPPQNGNGNHELLKSQIREIVREEIQDLVVTSLDKARISLHQIREDLQKLVWSKTRT